MSTQKPKVPVILYEEEKGGRTNLIPYIEVGINEEMPKVLFISEYKETGEIEPTSNGSAQIVDMIIHQYVDFEYLKTRLDSKTYDKIRVVLGMKPLKEAQKAGAKVLDNVFKNAEHNKKELETSQQKRMERTFELGEKLKSKVNEFMTENKDKS
jgi:hypothetical protein